MGTIACVCACVLHYSTSKNGSQVVDHPNRMNLEASKKNEPPCKENTVAASAGRGRKEEKDECTGCIGKRGMQGQERKLGRKDKCKKYCWDGV